MTDYMTETVRDQGYWSDLIDSYEDQEAPPDAASMAAADVSRMLGALRRLTSRLADYDVLHARELARLDERRTKLIGPVADRIAALEQALRDYGLRAYEDFGKTGTILATPNGSIRCGRPLVSELSIKDDTVEEWLKWLAPDAVTYKAKIGKADLRFHLEQGVDKGQYRQAIVLDRGPDGVVVLVVVDPAEHPMGWHGEFTDEQTGIWIRPHESTWPDAGEIITDASRIVQGVTWHPTGERGCGRNFTIDIG